MKILIITFSQNDNHDKFRKFCASYRSCDPTLHLYTVMKFDLTDTEMCKFLDLTKAAMGLRHMTGYA